MPADARAGEGEKERVVDEFVGFDFVLLDASGGPSQKVRVKERGERRERVDLIARQFKAFLVGGDQDDTEPHGLVLTPEFKVRRQATEKAGWLTFVSDDGGPPRELAHVVFAREDGPDARRAMARLEPFAHVGEMPRPPVVIAVELVPRVPSIVKEWYGRCVAGFFTAGE